MSLAVIFTAANILDAITTYISIEKFGATEANSAMALLISFGWEFFFAIKLLMGLLAVFFLIRCKILLKIATIGLLIFAIGNVIGIIMIGTRI